MILSYTDIYKFTKSNITGQVINKQTAQNIQGVIVSSNDLHQTALTDKQGKFQIAIKEQFPVKLLFCHPHYFLKEITIINSNNQIVYLDKR